MKNAIVLMMTVMLLAPNWAVAQSSNSDVSKSTGESYQAWERWDGEVVGWQATNGLIGGVLGGAAGLGVGYLFASGASNQGVANASALIGAGLMFPVGAAMGIYFTGSSFNGDGSFGVTALSATALGLVTGLFGFSAFGVESVSAIAGGSAFALVGVLGGGLLGYQLSSSSELSFSASFMPTAGGAQAGVAVQW